MQLVLATTSLPPLPRGEVGSRSDPGEGVRSIDRPYPLTPTLSPCAKACTHFEKRLKFRGLDDPRFWMRLYLGPAATVDKTRVFYTCQPLIKRCVHALAHRERSRASCERVRGYGLTIERNPSPARFASTSP